MSDTTPTMLDDWPTSEVEAVADAWASIDGKKEEFRAGRGMEIFEQPGGRYDGYMFEAGEMIGRLRRRGYGLVRLIHHHGKVNT